MKEYQDFDKTLGAVKTYNELSDSDLEDKYGLDDMFIEDLHVAYEVVKDNVKTAEGGNEGEDDDDSYDPDYELENAGSQEINYAYIVQLIQAYIPSDILDSTSQRLDYENVS